MFEIFLIEEKNGHVLMQSRLRHSLAKFFFITEYKQPFQ